MRHYRIGKCNMKHFMLRLHKNTQDKQFFPVQNFMISQENLQKLGEREVTH